MEHAHQNACRSRGFHRARHRCAFASIDVRRNSDSGLSEDLIGRPCGTSRAIGVREGCSSMKINKLLLAAVLAIAIAAPIAGIIGDTSVAQPTSPGVRVPFLHGCSPVRSPVSPNWLPSSVRTSG